MSEWVRKYFSISLSQVYHYLYLNLCLFVCACIFVFVFVVVVVVFVLFEPRYPFLVVSTGDQPAKAKIHFRVNVFQKGRPQTPGKPSTGSGRGSLGELAEPGVQDPCRPSRLHRGRASEEKGWVVGGRCPRVRCPFWLVLVEKSMGFDSWVTWWFNHLPGKSSYFP